MKVQERIANYVINNGIRQTFIAEKTGISKDLVCKTINLKRRMTADEFELFCKALNKKPSDFIQIED